MKRTYLEEDLQLIQKYFPGARTINLRTPFDLTARGGHAAQTQATAFHDDQAGRRTYKLAGDMVWLS